MYNNYQWCEMIAYEKIMQPRRAAARDRLVLAADKARRGTRQAAESPLAGLLRMLVGAFGLRRPALLSE